MRFSLQRFQALERVGLLFRVNSSSLAIGLHSEAVKGKPYYEREYSR